MVLIISHRVRQFHEISEKKFNFGQQVFFIKRSKATCAVIREEFPPVRLNSHRHVARQQIFTYSPFACNNKTIDSSSLTRIFLWLLIVATVCSTSCIFCAYLLLAPSSQAWSPNPRHDRQVENHSGPLLALDHWRGKLKAIMEV